MREEDMAMSQLELKRYHVLRSVVDGQLSPLDAADALGLSIRQTRRLRRRFAESGAAGIRHGNRDRTPSNAVERLVRDCVLELARTKYAGFNDTHFTECLAESEGITISRASISRILRVGGIASTRKRRVKCKHRKRRERRAAEGMMVLWDGSKHRWFGKAFPSCCLLGGIDDATGQMVAAHFAPQECSAGYLTLLKQMVSRFGIPCSIYQDRHSSLKRTDDNWSLEEQLAGKQDPTQVGAALEALGIEAIYAHSPEAKGRIERLWGTLQDRLVSELRLADITDIAAANAFLPDFIARHNARHAVPPETPVPMWRKAQRLDTDRLIAFRYQATVGNDNAVRLGGLIIDIPPGPRNLGYAKQQVEVRQLLNGRWRVYLKDSLLVETDPSEVVEPIRGYKHNKNARGAKTATDTPEGMLVPRRLTRGISRQHGAIGAKIIA